MTLQVENDKHTSALKGGTHSHQRQCVAAKAHRSSLTTRVIQAFSRCPFLEKVYHRPNKLRPKIAVRLDHLRIDEPEPLIDVDVRLDARGSVAELDDTDRRFDRLHVQELARGTQGIGDFADVVVFGIGAWDVGHLPDVGRRGFPVAELVWRPRTKGPHPIE
jgi:hypothetical protein